MTVLSSATHDTATNLFKRYPYGYYGNCYGGDCNSAWATWGRWVLLVGIVVAVLLIFFVFSCLNARRRRRRGIQPFRGTGWLAPQHGPVNYYGPNGPNTQNAQPHYQTGYEQYNAGPPPPAYAHSNAGYYGQESGLEMQPPQQAYHGQGGQHAYAPPPGPPPGKEEPRY